MEFTGYLDTKNTRIYLGDFLKSKWGFSVQVIKQQNGRFVGRLLARNVLPKKAYSLNCGEGYLKIH